MRLEYAIVYCLNPGPNDGPVRHISMATNVFIETSSLPRDFTDPGPGYLSLVELVQCEAVTVYLSELVLRERKSQLDLELQKIGDEVKKLKQSAAVHDAAIVGDAEKLSQSLSRESGNLAAKAIESVKSALRAKVIAVTGEHTSKVWQSYFEGEGAIRQPKHRGDLPDAFIFEAAKEVLGSLEGEPLHVIANDGQLNKAAAKLESCVTHKTIKEFLTSDAGKEATKSVAWWDDWEKAVGDATTGFFDSSETYEELLDEAIAEEISGHHVCEWGSAYTAPTVCGTTDAGKWTLSWHEAEATGPGWLSVPFQGVVDAEVDVSDLFDMPELRPLRVKVTGTAEIRLAEKHFRDKKWSAGAVSVEIDEVDDED